MVIYDEYGKTRMIRKGRYKYIHRYGGGPCELYDMERDPEEAEDLYGKEEYSSIIQSMKKEMEDWFARYTREKTDARKFSVKGRGQQKLCWEKDAFNPHIEFYHMK